MKKFLIIFLLVMILPMSAYAAAKKQKVGYLSITYETKDSFVIKSKLFYPKEQKDVYPVVVMLHSLGYSGDYWSVLTKKFVDSGTAVLVMDLRGHGASIYDSNFRIRSWRYFSDATYQKIPVDTAEIVKYIATNYKNISTTKYAVVGADLGANAAVAAMEKLHNKPKCMVLLSLTRDFKGIYTPISLANIGNIPILSIVSIRDNHSYKESQELKKFAQGTFDIKTYPVGGMGMLMLKANPSMAQDIVNWVLPQIK